MTWYVEHSGRVIAGPFPTEQDVTSFPPLAVERQERGRAWELEVIDQGRTE